ncbi:MAG: lysophospholipid acyltransferase family protein [Myxococcota bacterium]
MMPLTRGVAVTAFTATSYGVARVHMRATDEPGETFQRHLVPWARRTLRLLGGRPTIVGSPPEFRAKGRLVVANHRTAFDILVLWSLFGGSFLARGDIARWPLINVPARDAQTVFVDRRDRRSGAQAIRALRTALKGGRTVLVFPEGTTFVGDHVRPLHVGAFLASQRLDVDIVPVGLAYPLGVEWFRHSAGTHYRRLASHLRVPIGVAIGEPRSPGRAKDDAIAIRHTLQDLVGVARSQIAPHDQ